MLLFHVFLLRRADAAGKRGIIFIGLYLRQEIRNFACHNPETLNNTQHFHPPRLQDPQD